MKIFWILLMIINCTYASVFNYNIKNTTLVKNNCSKIKFENGFFKISKCLKKDENVFVEDLECIFNNKVICSSNSKNFILDGKFQVINNHIHINSGFLNMMEITYSVK